MSLGSLPSRSCLPSDALRPAGGAGPVTTAATGRGLADAARPLANNSIWG
ncbi:hypothetical protein [Kitasatospora sp. NPDC057015]